MKLENDAGGYGIEEKKSKRCIVCRSEMPYGSTRYRSCELLNQQKRKLVV